MKYNIELLSPCKDATIIDLAIDEDQKEEIDHTVDNVDY